LALVLASSSPIRRTMLTAAGLLFEVAPADVDEYQVKKDASVQPSEIADWLARAKAETLSARRPDEWVIGSDSVVSVEGRLFDKPADRLQAADHLRFFSGKLMRLTSAVALARDGDVDWHHVETAQLRMRALSDPFIEAYLDAEWPAVGHCVGVFRMEGRGVQLFERIQGDHFTILGMPLIPLLGALRERGELRA
jgi:septum formation protein